MSIRKLTKQQLLFRKFKDLTVSDTQLRHEWILDEEIVQRIKQHDGFADTSTGSLNAAVTKNISFIRDRHKFDDGDTIFHFEHRLNVGGKRKRANFYLVKSTDDVANIPTANSALWQDICNVFFQTSNLLSTTTTSSEKSGRKRRRSTLSRSQNTKRVDNSSSTSTNSKNSALNPSFSLFETKIGQLRISWKEMYGDVEPFPSDVISFTDARNVVLPSAPHVAAATSQDNDDGVYDKETQGVYYKKSYVVIRKIDYTKSLKARAFLDAMKKGVSYKRCELRTPHSKSLLAAFAASHPQVVPANIQMCVALGRYTLLHDVQSSIPYDFEWISLQTVAQSSPKSTAIDNWVKELATVQVLIAREKLSDSRIFYQADGGHKGQEVKVLSGYLFKTKKIV